ncbi:MAG: PEP-CTERM sorting domain-containing protein, partial [Alphaproteobacteria bacterium]|nr:PEP-CTERM sorting domain-containing protein [Alphaproteobacteria bacterium]
SALSVNQNFQANNLYYMGVSDASNTIRSVVFSYSGAGTGDRIGIDNILFAQVPEQATLTLFGLGLLGLGFARRRK